MRHAVGRRVIGMYLHVLRWLLRRDAFRRRRWRVWELWLHGRRGRSLVRLVVGVRPRCRRRLPRAIVLVVLVFGPAVSHVMDLLRRRNGR